MTCICHRPLGLWFHHLFVEYQYSWISLLRWFTEWNVARYTQDKNPACQYIVNELTCSQENLYLHVTNLAKFDAFEYWYNHSMQLIQHDACTLIYASVGGCNFLFNILTNPILDIIYFFNIYWYIHFHFIFKMKIHVQAYWTLYDHFVLYRK